MHTKPVEKSILQQKNTGEISHCLQRRNKLNKVSIKPHCLASCSDDNARGIHHLLMWLHHEKTGLIQSSDTFEDEHNAMEEEKKT